MKIGEVLKSWRNHQEMTIDEAAKEIGLPWDTYRRLERGSQPQMTTFWAILKWLVGD